MVWKKELIRILVQMHLTPFFQFRITFNFSNSLFFFFFFPLHIFCLQSLVTPKQNVSKTDNHQEFNNCFVPFQSNPRSTAQLQIYCKILRDPHSLSIVHFYHLAFLRQICWVCILFDLIVALKAIIQLVHRYR